jgi:hypothetical protein
MKSVKRLLLQSCLLGFTGCAPTLVVTKATESRGWHEKEGEMVQGPVHWEYYCLLPLTVPWDMATLPFQAIVVPSMLKGMH